MSSIPELTALLQKETNPEKRKELENMLNNIIDEKMQFFEAYMKRVQTIMERLSHQRDPPPLSRYFHPINY